MEEGLLFRQIRCTALQILVLVLLLTCQHNPLRTTSSLKDLCQPAISFLLFFQFLLYCILIISKMASRSGISYFSPIQSIPPHPTSWRFIVILIVAPCVNYVYPSYHYIPIYACFYQVDVSLPVSTPKSRTRFSRYHKRYMTHPSHSSRFFNRTIFGEEYISLIFSLCSFPTTILPHPH